MITKSLMYTAVCLLLVKNVVSDHLSGCKWIQSNHLKCEGLNAVNDSKILQYSYQNCNEQPDKTLQIVNSNMYTIDVTTLPPNFCNFKQISVISSNVGVVLANAFTMNQNVFEIDFSFNNIDNLGFMNRPFNKLSRLIISHNNLDSINFDVLAKMRSLRELKLDHNSITRIHQFSKYFNSLKTLDLSYNKIEYLDFHFLGRFETLEILKMHGNPISSFEYSMPTSHILKHFSITKITEFSNHRLEDLAESEILQIVDGKIERIESLSFLTHRNLKRLYLDNTVISELSYQAFRDSTLKYVGPSNNFYEHKGAIVFNFTGMSVQNISENVFQMVTAPNHALDIILDNNQIFKIFFETFFNLNLYSLSIGFSGIVELEPRSFTELRFLECGHLDLSNNRITKLRADVFHNITKVSAINLANNLLEDIEVGAFNNIEMFCEAHLILSNNKITSLSSQIFKNITNLKNLYLNQNLLRTIDGASLEGLLSLELIDLNNNLISEVSKENFVHTPNLQTLNIASNRIESLTENIGLKSLNRLELQNNPFQVSDIENWNVSDTISWNLTELSKSTLTYFRNVKNLMVVDSCIETVQSMAFLETSALVNLYFVNTTIKSLNDRAFEGSKITFVGPYVRGYGRYLVLDLSKLSLRDVGVEAFQNMNISQAEIILDNNNLTKIRSRTFSNVHNLISIHIENSGLLELEADSFINLSFNHLDYNNKINLRNNRIRILKTNTFKDIQDIRNIDLSENQIEEIESMAFSNISTSDFKLLLNNNKIKTLPSQGFMGRGVWYFSYLDLSDNLLTKLDGNEFKNIGQMGNINLQNNRLENFNSTALPFFVATNSIWLRGNPVFQIPTLKNI